MMDEFRWPLDQGLSLDDGPPLDKEYNLDDPMYTFWDDFLGPHSWLWGMSGEGETAADSEGKVLRLAGIAGNGDKDTVASSEGSLLGVIAIEGESQSETESGGLLNASLVLPGEESIVQSKGIGAAQEIKLIEGTSKTSSLALKDFYWPLDQGLPLDDGPLLDKEYNLDDPAYTFFDDFLGPHRYFVQRLKSLSGISAANAGTEGILTLFWGLTGVSKMAKGGTSVLTLDWDLSGESMMASEGEGTLALLWRMFLEGFTYVDSRGRVLRVRQMAGESLTTAQSQGILIKWPLSIKLEIKHLGVEAVNYVGSTITLMAEFHNSEGKLEDPGDVCLRIYDGSRKMLDVFKVEPRGVVGRYRHDYVIPGDPPGPLIFEYSGAVGNKVKLARARIERVWAE